MNQQGRPLREYFDALREEPGISESEVRTILGRADAPRTHWSKGAVATLVLGVAGMFVLLYAILAPASEEQQVQEMKGAFPLGSPARAAVRGPLTSSGSTITIDTSSAPTARPVEGTGIRNSTDINPIEHTAQEKKPMEKRLKRKFHAALATGVVALTLGATDTSAQGHKLHTGNERPDGRAPVVKQLESEVGTLLSDYWQPKLNIYKVRIDRALASNDLDVLNKLRVRFGVLVSELAAKVEQKEETRRSIHSTDAGKELMAIYNETRELAERNRQGLSPLSDVVSEDLVECVTTVHKRMERFVSEHHAELQSAKMAAHLSEGMGKVDSMTAWFRSGEGQMIYKLGYLHLLEPLLMLYDGNDLKTLLQQFGHVTRAKGGGDIQFDKLSPLPGIALPEVSVLKQSVPNPSRSSASIAYTLPAASTASTLRIFNAQGALVATYERGAEAVGDHSVDVDVSGFAAGTYFYRLTVSGEGAEQVYSKTMQVAR